MNAALLHAAVAQAEALVLQLRTLAAENVPVEDGPPRCPRCGDTQLIAAGKDLVCPCGANIRDGEIVGG